MESRKNIDGQGNSMIDVVSKRWQRWLPSRGNIIFTLLIALGITWTQSSGVFARNLSELGSGYTRPIPYQGRLADASGNPLTNTYPMIFRLYSSGTNGVPLWEENWNGPNSVQVSDGLFNVMLGSLTPIPENVITTNEMLWLGITVGTDDEMTPRIQLGTVPYSHQAQTVPDGSITAEKIAEGAIPPGVPVGTVISWWRTDASTPLPAGEWAFADGSIVNDPASPINGKKLPDLRNRFVMGVDSSQIGTNGGANSLEMSHSHTVNSHTHTVNGETSEVYRTWDGGYWAKSGDEYRFAVNTYGNAWYYRHDHMVNLTTSATETNTNSFSLSFDNRPEYVGLVYLVKIK